MEHKLDPSVTEIKDDQSSSFRPWDIEQIVTKAFNNKSQVEGSISQLIGKDWCYKQFESLEALLLTIPKKKIKTFDEFVVRVQNTPVSEFPKPFNHSTYSLDWDSTILNGPFFNENKILVEQAETDRPQFIISWKNDGSKLYVTFLKTYDQVDCQYTLEISDTLAVLLHNNTRATLAIIDVNSDGSLA